MHAVHVYRMELLLIEIASVAHCYKFHAKRTKANISNNEETENYFVLIDDSTISVILENRPDLSLRCR